MVCCTADVDKDGHLDLYVTYWGLNALYRNKGNGTFSDVTAKSNTGGTESKWSTGCTFLDYDRDGHVDLLVASYLRFDLKTGTSSRLPVLLFMERQPCVLRPPWSSRRRFNFVSQSRRRHI